MQDRISGPLTDPDAYRMFPAMLQWRDGRKVGEPCCSLKSEYVGLKLFGRAAAHANDLRTIATSKSSLQEQVDITI